MLMRKGIILTYLVLCLLTLVSYGQEDCQICDTDFPVSGTLILSQITGFNSNYCNVTHYEVDGEDLFLATFKVPIDGLDFPSFGLYNCEGTELCIVGGLLGDVQCSTLGYDIGSYTDGTLLWSGSCSENDVYEHTYDENCVSECIAANIDEADCSDTVFPVCGCNGVTYDNSCLAQAAGVHSFYTGVCDCLCTDIYEPVCGSDGLTYANSCQAECAGVTFSDGICSTIPSCEDAPGPQLTGEVIFGGILIGDECDQNVELADGSYITVLGIPNLPPVGTTITFSYQEVQQMTFPGLPAFCPSDYFLAQCFNEGALDECTICGVENPLTDIPGIADLLASGDFSSVVRYDNNGQDIFGLFYSDVELDAPFVYYVDCAGNGICSLGGLLGDFLCVQNEFDYEGLTDPINLYGNFGPNNPMPEDCINPCFDTADIADCDTTEEPVCACNGVTYLNPCEAENAGVYSYIAGSCECQCDETQVSPVCGEDGLSYQSACFAGCAGVAFTDGLCTEAIPCPSDGEVVTATVVEHPTDNDFCFDLVLELPDGSIHPAAGIPTDIPLGTQVAITYTEIEELSNFVIICSPSIFVQCYSLCDAAALNCDDNDDTTTDQINFETCACENIPMDDGGMTGDNENIPTLSQWGVIFLLLILFNCSLLTLFSQQLAISGNKQNISIKQWNKWHLPYDSSLFLKGIGLAVLIMFGWFILSTLLYGYVTQLDIIGSIFAMPFFAYLYQLYALLKDEA